jgi:P27 family predicted phage terminase small subunit
MPNPRTPTLLKDLRGTARPDRANPQEPQSPALSVGERPPAWVRGAAARRAWKALIEIAPPGLITQLDAMALGLLVNAFSRYLAALDVVEGRSCGLCGRSLRSARACSSGEAHFPGDPFYTTRTKEGSLMIRRHPAASEATEWHDKIVALLGRFGMDPADRSRVSAGESGPAEDPVESFLGGRRSA